MAKGLPLPSKNTSQNAHLKKRKLEVEKSNDDEVEQRLSQIKERYPKMKPLKALCAVIYERSAGNVSITIKKLNISRRTFYLWKETDDDFAELIKETDEEMIDTAETQLRHNIVNGDTTALIFFLKTKGRERGYVEKIEHEDVTDKSLDAETAGKRYDIDNLMSRHKKALEVLKKVRDREKNDTTKPKPKKANTATSRTSRSRKGRSKTKS